MTTQMVSRVLQVIDATFKPEHLDEAAAEMRLMAWCGVLSDVNDDEAMQALVSCMRNSPFAPKPHDIRAEALRARGTLTNGEAWNIAMDTAKKIARIIDRTTGVRFVDGRPSGELLADARRMFDQLPQAVRNWAGSYDALAALATRDPGDLLSYERPRFNAVLDDARQRGTLPTTAQLAAGHTAAQITEGR